MPQLVVQVVVVTKACQKAVAVFLLQASVPVQLLPTQATKTLIICSRKMSLLVLLLLRLRHDYDDYF